MNHTSYTLKTLLVTVLLGWLTLQPAAGAETNQTRLHARTSPEWLRSAVVYQIFPRNFSKEGTFNAITDRMDELQDLGVDVLWLMPIHPIGEKMKKGSLGSPYAVRDFYAVNPNYGTTNDLKRLIKSAHQRGMKVVLDIVTGHTAWDSVLMEHKDYYKQDENGNIIPPNPAWTDVAALNYENTELRRYMIDMMKYWLTDFDVDGFRCDVAFVVPTDFWVTAREELTKIRPEVILFADANAKPELLYEAFDMDNSWPLFYALNRTMSGISSAELVQQSWENTRQQFPEGALHLRFSDGQPEPREVALFGVHGALAAQVFMLTIDGVPLFYNGMEVGDATESADPALFEKMPVFWTPAGRPPLREIYRELIKLRKQYPAFQSDDVIWLQNSVPTDVISIMRKDQKDEFVILVNLTNRKVSGSVTLPNAKGFQLVKLESVENSIADALPEFRLAAYEWHIYHRSLAK